MKLPFAIARIVLLLAALLLRAGAAEISAEHAEFFEKRIRPLLAEHCYDCHGTDTGDGGLKVNSREGILAGGDSGPAAVAGKPAESLLLKAVTRDGKKRMPKNADPLSAEQIKALEQWINIGLPWPEVAAGTVETMTLKEPKFTDAQRAYWAFQPVKKAPPPAVKDAAWCRNDVDRFLLAEMEKAALKPAATAGKRTLLRRATFDLTGLPPTPEEVAAFLADTSPDAFAKVVERLLASPHYGERAARLWLDGARYADNPSNDDGGIGIAYAYRDWVVRSFNEDMPYDRFIAHQLAGDLLEPRTDDGIIATAFLAIGVYSDQDSDVLKQHAALVDDQIDTIGKSMLGLTLACARCHDHKFDPITQTDYYALAGIFRSTSVRTKHDAKRVRLTVPLGGFKLDDKKGPRGVYAAQDGGAGDAPWKGKIEDSPLFIRGDPRRLGPVVPRRFPLILAGEKQTPLGERTKASGRLELARWIGSAENPLTARVLVNRLWQQHFGAGLVRTPFNFGKLGQPPTHPALLDFLAAKFVESGWSQKAMHRLIVNSAAYQQSAAPSSDARERDPENRLLSHAPRRRLEMEQLRDALLAASGTLDRTLGGPAVKPDAPRRALYVFTTREEGNDPFRALFDAAELTSPVERRGESTTPSQSLYFLNSPTLIAHAEALAERLRDDKSLTDDRARLTRAYELLYVRPPTDAEHDIAAALLRDGGSWPELCQLLFAANEFVYLD